ncbi:MAG TPA: glycoside hydrolase family 1 protein [Candidatus Omnitrophota bacterium]|nr:glycoside hydrolase family 1 protein [Candidatus Omnitrophota bacterium]HNQ50436.1 glycoside hydrolase family 1 protein [Candidatus Omnitrophota bacterium]HQO37420.1 glycoside hydrolase family 1 protein [Candidatus Omnitrophota bacterium]HQQ05703.1 glycoside hydrolase family 1 protein [Candidatus Omnitrophota bacterium]
MMRFPDKFLWGAATSAHQVEGNNTNSDWWHWEQRGGGKAPSAGACRHYERYREDFDLAGSLGHTCHRLSVEWSRIEPRQGEFSAEAIAHYKDVIAALRERSIEPVVTLHHFTSPQWFAEQGGWACPRAADHFLAYVNRIVSELAGSVTYWVTINEPLIYVFYGYIVGDWPPNVRSLPKALAARNNFLRSHVRAYRLIHAIYEKRGLPRPKVSIAHHMPAYTACTGSIRDRLGVRLRNAIVNHNILGILARRRTLDYIGVNYYSRTLVHADSWSMRDLVCNACSHHDDTLAKNSLGWEIYPQGIYDILMMLNRYRLPVFILENGICTPDDSVRWDFIREHLSRVHAAIQNGIAVIGYAYWSFMDNFEWDKGFDPRFGLIGIDYRTGARTVRDSARKYSKVCSTNQLE